MSYRLIALIASFLFAEARLHHHFGELRGRAKLLTDKLVPNPSSTTTRLNGVEKAIVEWPEAHLSNYTSNVSASAYSTNVDGAPTGNVTDVNEALKQIEQQSNAGLDQLTGTTAASSMMIDLLRLNVSRFEKQTNEKISRLESILNELGDASTNGISAKVRDIQSQIDQFKSQISSVVGKDGPGQFVTRINQLGDSITAVNDRVSALEKGNQAAKQSAEAQGTANSMAATASFQFVLESWTGRIALGGAVFGIVALILSVVALMRLPPKPAAEAEAKPEEQVLMEAGEQPAAEGEDPNAAGDGTVYEEPQAEEEQQY